MNALLPFRHLIANTIATLILLTIAPPSRAADQIIFIYPPFGEFSVSINDLEVFAKEGRITPDFAFYARRVKPEQLQQFRELLQQRFDYSPIYVSQFTYAPLVEKLLDRLGGIIQTDSRDNGMKSLRSALILAAADPTEGLTALNALRRFPSQRIHLQLTEGLAIVSELSALFKRRDTIVTEIRKLAAVEASQPPQFRTQFPKPGAYLWKKQTYNWVDPDRQRPVPTTLYLPLAVPQPIPTIVISHGVAENRETFAYFAEQMASHGFAVAVIAHVGGDADRLQQYLAGLAPPPPATELIDRPRDVSFLLDELQRQSTTDTQLQSLNLKQVGLMGHSLGGYTVFALAGATIDFANVKRLCNPNRSLNLSTFLQCRAGELPMQSYTLKDPRIKAIVALNPLGNVIFGQQGLSQINLPTLLIGGSQDVITPVVPEQISPFTWIASPDKYLAILENGTHFSVGATADSNPSDSNPSDSNPSDSKALPSIPVPKSLIGPNPAIAHAYTQALGLAFFQTYLADRPTFASYLSTGYAKSISQTAMPLIVLPAKSAPQVLPILQANPLPPPSQ